MTAPSQDAARNALMLTELRLPTIGRLWPEFAERSDKEGWPAARFLGGLLEHELAERAKRRIERHRAEWLLDVTKTLIGHALIDAGHRVLYMRTSKLVQTAPALAVEGPGK